MFHPKGGILRKELEDYSRRKHVEAGYQFVNTPHITKEQLYVTSGHLEWYADGMFPPMHIDAEYHDDGTLRKPGQNYYLKPMNCPMHHLIYRSRGRSYRELPLRLFEFGSVYRYEKSGVIHGLTRVRGMTQDDAHIYCTREQMRDELTSLLQFVLDLLADYGLDDFYLELSTKDPDKYVGADDVWDEATETLREVAEASGLTSGARPGRGGVLRAEDLRPGQGRAGPQLADVDHPARLQHARPVRAGVHRRRRNAATPGDDPPRAVRLHRAVLRCAHRALRRCVPGVAGPVQVVGIPVADGHASYLEDVAAQLRSHGLRAEVDASDDRMAEEDRQPHQPEGAVHAAGRRPRRRGRCRQLPIPRRTQINGVPRDEAIAAIVEWVADRENATPTAELVRRG